MEFAEENINDIKNKSVDKLIQDYMAFIVKTVSSITGRYVSIENDDENDKDDNDEDEDDQDYDNENDD